ncbi:hypothetical protein GH714_022691 [Hevea brasiliensis]|uniref:Uncharacterized protein n=1 Tax=Hevea brasiliensis TaxID=3981 RepID=A0A6A6M345_HEVBR|nr:hypothetical protein GH714_022691 [Hevea brasiliensis]
MDASRTNPSSLSLLDRVAIVTGSSRGIGKAIAVHLATLGAKLVINYSSNRDQAQLVAQEINSSFPHNHSPRAITVQANVSDPAHVKSLFDEAETVFGSPVHVLVNSAGVVDSKYPSIANTSLEDFDLTFSVNTRGAFLCSKEAANRLKRGGGGRIILVSSSMVGGLKPGPIATEMFFSGRSEELIRKNIEECPLGRLGETKDIAPIVGFLATDASEWINGQSNSSNPSPLPLQDRVAIVTGASRGIGKAIAVHLASLGAKLVINYSSNRDQAQLVAEEINSSFPHNHSPRAITVQANVSDPSHVKSLFDEAERVFGSPVHVLVNSAGVLDPKYPSIANTSLEDFDLTFSFKSSSRDNGKDISKGTQGTGITANCIAPGPIATEMYFSGKTEEQIRKNIDECPLGRLGETKDIAPIVGFLATDASEWINGQVIRANGGYV